DAQARESRLLGLVLDETLVADFQPYGEGAGTFLAAETSYTLVVVFSELSCNTCLDEQLEFLHAVQKIPPQRLALRGLVAARREEYIGQFRRVHRLAFPFFRTTPARLAEDLHMHEGPLLLLIDRDRQVVAA